MLRQIEKVFIAWGGNQDTAKMVGAGLNERGFRGIVGGENPSDMYIGDTVFSQLRQCTRAIILVENTRQDSENPFSSNLMLEWGYLTAKKDPSKLHVFLIGVLTRELPSDLLGIWAKEIKNITDKTREQIAKEIIDNFCEEVSKPVDIDKIKILNNWIEIKRNLSIYTSEPIYSEIELAHYLLHSMEACYYYEEQESLLDIIEKIEPVSSELEYVIQIVKANTKLFEESFMLLKPLPNDSYYELRDFLLETEPEFSIKDENLVLWLKYFRYNRLALLKMLAVKTDDEINFDLEYKRDSFSQFIEYNGVALRTLNEIAGKYPKEEIYTKLYEGYVYRDLYKTYTRMSDIEKQQKNDEAASEYYKKAGESICESAKARRFFNQKYKDRNPGDEYLIKFFTDEYYISRIEQHEFITNAMEKKENEFAIRSFYSKHEKDKGRMHAVKIQLHEVYNNTFNKL